MKRKTSQSGITSRQWIFRATDLANKQELFDFAASCQVPLETPAYQRALPYRDDEDLYLSFWDGLMSVSGTREEVNTTEEQFREMCKAYAASLQVVA